jgi:FkbM family methyltransferase
MKFRSLVTDFIKAVGRKSGVELSRASNVFEQRLTAALVYRKLHHVVDVGGNVGQFGDALYRTIYCGALLSFEPQPDAHIELSERAKDAAALGRNWRVAPPMALAETDGTTTFHHYSKSAMSSLLQPAEHMRSAVPSAEVVKRYEVRLARLDKVLPELWPERPDFALKIDTQGSEQRVLEGAQGVLAQAKLIQLEVSIGQLYDGQPSYHEIDNFMRDLDFELIDLEPGYRVPESNALLEFDVVYARR